MTKTIKVRKGQGYYDLTWYPWGGAFRRFPEDAELSIIEDRESRGHIYHVLDYKGTKVGVSRP